MKRYATNKKKLVQNTYLLIGRMHVLLLKMQGNLRKLDEDDLPPPEERPAPKRRRKSLTPRKHG